MVHRNQKCSCYVARGYYFPGKGLDSLKQEMRSYLHRGYTVVKMKIGGVPLDEDLRRIEAVLGELASGQQLAVDANRLFSEQSSLRQPTRALSMLGAVSLSE